MVSWRDVAFDSLSDYGCHKILLTFVEPSEEAMADITILNFDKDGVLVGELQDVRPEITDVVLIAHGWSEGQESALGHHRDLVGPLEVILSHNRAQWQGHTVAYFGVIWPSDKYADDLTVINMRAEVGGPPPAGIVAGGPTAPSLNDADLEARARDVAEFLGIDPDQLATQALQAAGDEGARDALVSTLQNATAVRRQSLADEQTKVEHDVTLVLSLVLGLPVSLVIYGGTVAEVQARDFGQYTNLSAERREWFKRLAPPGRNPALWSCCGESDVVHTKFRVNKKDGTDEWMYFTSAGTWKVVPPDIILWDKINDPMNDGQARLWASPYLKDPDGTPKPICFIPPRSGN
jgi:hypothetical protein